MSKAKSINELVVAKMATLRKGNDYCATATGNLVKSIGTRGKVLDADIHAAAMASLHRASAHRDCNTFKLLLNAMPKSARAATLATWGEHFGNMVCTRSAKDKSWSVKMKPEAECSPVNFDKAMATPFWTKQETKPVSFNDLLFANAVAALIKRAEGANADLSAEAKAALADLKVGLAKLPVAKEGEKADA